MVKLNTGEELLPKAESPTYMAVILCVPMANEEVVNETDPLTSGPPPPPIGAVPSNNATPPVALDASPLIAETTAVKVTGLPDGTLVAPAETVTAVLAMGLGRATRRTRSPRTSEMNSGPEGERAKPAGIFK